MLSAERDRFARIGNDPTADHYDDPGRVSLNRHGMVGSRDPRPLVCHGNGSSIDEPRRWHTGIASASFETPSNCIFVRLAMKSLTAIAVFSKFS